MTKQKEIIFMQVRLIHTGTRRNKVFINFMKLLAYCSYPLTYVILYVILFDVIKVE